jgi:hypothetical protein
MDACTMARIPARTAPGSFGHASINRESSGGSDGASAAGVPDSVPR